MIKTALFFLLTFVCLNLNGQGARTCSHSASDLQLFQERLIQNKKYLATNPSRSRNKTVYIPVKYHLVGDFNGVDRISYQQFFDQHCLLNDAFSQYDISFYIKDGLSIVDNSQINEDQTSTVAINKMRSLMDDRAINVWLVRNPKVTSEGADNVPPGRILGYYNLRYDWIVLDKVFVNNNGKTFLHELGHFFGLLHTFHGWDFEPYMPESTSAVAPINSPRGIKTELADNSNCNEAGDMLCDTPADYNSALFWSGTGCNYTEKILDPNGIEINPDETLFMSYFSDRCINAFTPNQADIIIADYNRPGRNFLRIDNFTPNDNEISATPQLVSPINSAVTSSFNKVELKWEATAGADSYLVEIDRSASFNIDKIQLIAFNQNYLVVEDILDADRNYRWRVTPYNASYTCATPSETARFRTGISTSVASIESVDDWTIQPNPIRASDAITIKVNAKKAFKAAIKIYTVTGQLVENQPALTFGLGTSTIQVPIAKLSKGVYFLALENEVGILNKKLIIQ